MTWDVLICEFSLSCPLSPGANPWGSCPLPSGLVLDHLSLSTLQGSLSMYMVSPPSLRVARQV